MHVDAPSVHFLVDIPQPTEGAVRDRPYSFYSRVRRQSKSRLNLLLKCFSITVDVSRFSFPVCLSTYWLSNWHTVNYLQNLMEHKCLVHTPEWLLKCFRPPANSLRHIAYVRGGWLLDDHLTLYPAVTTATVISFETEAPYKTARITHLIHKRKAAFFPGVARHAWCVYMTIYLKTLSTLPEITVKSPRYISASSRVELRLLIILKIETEVTSTTL